LEIEKKTSQIKKKAVKLKKAVRYNRDFVIIEKKDLKNIDNQPKFKLCLL
jgi:hypothetical protein